MVADPLAQQGLDTIDLRLLSTLRDSTAKELTLPAWPGQFKRAPPQEGPDSQMEGQVQKLADARTLVRGVVLNRLLTCPEDLVISIMYDGAKMANGCIRKELVQTVIHVMCPQLQVPLMNYVQTLEHLTRRERVVKRARAEACARACAKTNSSRHFQHWRKATGCFSHQGTVCYCSSPEITPSGRSANSCCQPVMRSLLTPSVVLSSTWVSVCWTAHPAGARRLFTRAAAEQHTRTTLTGARRLRRLNRQGFAQAWLQTPTSVSVRRRL